MKGLKKTLASALSFVIFTLCLSVHLTTADGSEVYTASAEDSRYSYCVNSDGSVKVKASDNASFTGELKIPSSLDGKNVTAVSDRGFIGQKLVTKLVLPETVSAIGESAFSNCSVLEKVEVKGTITDIGLYPFFATPFEKNLEEKNDFVIFNGDILYDYTGSSTNISIPDGIRVVSGTLFTYFETKRDFEINYVTFPDSVEYICSKAFYDCNNMIRITLGTGIKNIGENAFTAADMTIMGYYDTYAQTYASDHGFTFEPIIPYGTVSETVYADFSDGFRQYYFTDEKEFSREGVFVYRRNYNGEKIGITDWEYSSALTDLYS